MCSYSWQIRMDNNQGDLGDIVRASGCGAASGAGPQVFDAGWQLPPELVSLPSVAEGSNGDFGDPFSNFNDLLLHELAGATLFDGPDLAAGLVEMMAVGNDGGGGSGSSDVSQKMVMGDDMRPCSIVSKASSMVSPNGIRPSTVFTADMVKVNTSLAGRPVDEGGLQISSNRNHSIKRRKGQAKKIVCIPAPAAANSRPGGEVVPPDLWAWRKYGQKPIKGSPHPRAYYRCSSSKGCSARKQVERSRTDPGMLVITYTSEHNHPWPTQRNALAGSTRPSQPTAKNSSSAPKSSHPNPRSPTSPKEESKETANLATMSSPPNIKEAAPELVEKLVDINIGEHRLDQLLRRSYDPMAPEPADPSVDDLFTGLSELEGDPMTLVFSKQFIGGKPEEGKEAKAVDPFSIFHWGGN